MSISTNELARKLIELEGKLHDSNDLGWEFDHEDKEILAKSQDSFDEDDVVYEQLFIVSEGSHPQAKYACWLRENAPTLAMNYVTILNELKEIQQTLQTVHLIFGSDPHGEEEWIASSQLGKTITKIDRILKS